MESAFNPACKAASATVVMPILGLLVMAVILTPGFVRAETVTDATTEVDRYFTVSGEQQYTVPAGVNNMDVELIGGYGADRGAIMGGRPVKVSGRIEVVPGSGLYLMVGGNGLGTNGGFNGGGDAQSSPGAATGGGGGGASDIRTIAPGEAGSLESRIVIAAGGGGAGATANGGGKAGGAGGDAGVAGVRAESAGPGNSIGSGGFGGGPGAPDAPGTGGAAGQPLGGGVGETGRTGNSGTLGSGGRGGGGPDNTTAGGGGGGGGGLFGGGGGGGGGTMPGASLTTGGGGGGGASALVPPGGIWVIETSANIPKIRVGFSVPGTQITAGPTAFTVADSASFSFEASQAGSILQCRLDEAAFTVCASPLAVSGLTEGTHVMRVRAINQMDNFDPTPAEWRFTVDRTAPVATIVSGPGGQTLDPLPEFAFSSNESEATFRCGFDSAPLGDCVGSDWHKPAAELSVGSHTFTVQARDQAGNLSTRVSRKFEVVTSLDPPQGATQLTLGKPLMNRKKGFVILPATSSVTGTIWISSKRTWPQSKPVQAGGTVRLKVLAVGPAQKKLKRRGKVKLKVKVGLVGEDGSEVKRIRKVTIRKQLKKKHKRLG